MPLSQSESWTLIAAASALARYDSSVSSVQAVDENVSTTLPVEYERQETALYICSQYVLTQEVNACVSALAVAVVRALE